MDTIHFLHQYPPDSGVRSSQGIYWAAILRPPLHDPQRRGDANKIAFTSATALGGGQLDGELKENHG